MEELLKLLGFTTPLVYAGAAYGVFHWLDENASDDAKAALAGAMKLTTFGGIEISAALVELFDRLYTYPLLRWRALLRSAILTLLLSAVVVVEVVGPKSLYDTFSSAPTSSLVGATAGAFVIAVLIDYVSLFVVRDWLTLCGIQPWASFWIGLLLAFCLMVIGIFPRILGPAILGQGLTSEQSMVLFGTPSLVAFAVYAWLPLFAIGMLAIRLVKPLSWLVGKARWFLKEGKEHPLKAIGYVAAVVVFVGSVAARTVFSAL